MVSEQILIREQTLFTKLVILLAVQEILSHQVLSGTIGSKALQAAVSLSIRWAKPIRCLKTPSLQSPPHVLNVVLEHVEAETLQNEIGILVGAVHCNIESSVGAEILASKA